MNGLAGTGKSTIAQTIAERLFADARLSASFFCSRDFEDRRVLRFIFPTIAVQLARRHAKFRSILVPLVQSDSEIIHESLDGQMKKLIVQPLRESGISTVIVIDALDECKGDEPALAILSVLAQFVKDIPKVKFFITGRPEPRIRNGIGLSPTDVFVLHEVDPDQVNSDIRLFYKHNFSEIRSRHPGLDNWPIKEQLDLLCECTAGLFIYAMATVRFVDQKSKNPKSRLDQLIRSQESRLEGKTKLRAAKTLDLLYITIFHEAFGDDDDPEHNAKVRSVLGAVVLAANPLSPSAIAKLLGLDIGDVFPLLSSLHSLLILSENIDEPVRPFHKSFSDFITDPSRCSDPRFYIPPGNHINVFLRCLKLMGNSLKKNMCSIPDHFLNFEMQCLAEMIEASGIRGALEYACSSWFKHLILTEHHTSDALSALRDFLENKFIFWLEVLSVLGVVDIAFHALGATLRWLNQVCLDSYFERW